MALIINAKGLMSGKEGPIVYSHNRFGAYTRRLVIPTNPNSPRQAAIRSALQNLSNVWFNVLTPEQREAWADYAANVPVTNRLGASIHLTGLNMFVRSNTQVQASAPSIRQDQAPAIFDLGVFTPPAVDTFVAGPPSTVNINFTATDDWVTAGANGRLGIYISKPNDPTVNFFKGPYQFWGYLNPVAHPSPYVLTLPWPVVAGQRLFFAFRGFCADGRLSVQTTFRLDC